MGERCSSVEMSRRSGSSCSGSESGYGHIWALFYLAEVKLALGKVTEAETLFDKALESGRKQWAADDFRLEKLLGQITKARAALTSYD